MSARNITRFGMLLAAIIGTLGAALSQSWFEICWIWLAVWWCFDATSHRQALP